MQNSKSHKVWNFIVFLGLVGVVAMMVLALWFPPAAIQTDINSADAAERMRAFGLIGSFNFISMLVLMVYGVAQSVRGSSTVLGKIGWAFVSIVGSFLIIVIPVLQFTIFKKWDAERVAAKVQVN